MKKLKIVYNAPVVLSFVIICLVATIVGMITNGRVTDLLFVTYHSSLTSPMTYIRFITHVFGHADWSHFIANASYLLLLGPMLEEKYGSIKILEIMLTTAIVTALVNYIFFTNVGLCGASGIVFAFILLISFTSFREGEIPLTFILVAVIFLGQEVFDGIILNDNISNMAHIVGGIIGATVGYQLNKKSKYNF